MSATPPQEKPIKKRMNEIMDYVGREMFGLEEVTQLCLTALYCGGHVLLEGNPGMGKTKLVRTLERILKLPYGRIQFTPDLMPTDITGSKMPDDENRQKLSFRRGPIFTSLLLADEINRASPKTQAAMLEAMAEKEVTVQGTTHTLGAPFMVLATQNPIDHDGTYPLPEAQADRFMFKIRMPYPKEETLHRIIDHNTGPLPEPALSGKVGLTEDEITSGREEYNIFHRNIRRVEAHPALKTHVVNLLLASNGHIGELREVSGKRQKRAAEIAEQLVLFGLGPRAAESLVIGSKAYALLFLLDRGGGAGPEALAKVLLPTLRHRLKLTFGWEERYAATCGLSVDEENQHLLNIMLAELSMAVAPQNPAYEKSFTNLIKGQLPPEARKLGSKW